MKKFTAQFCMIAIALALIPTIAHAGNWEPQGQSKGCHYYSSSGLAAGTVCAIVNYDDLLTTRPIAIGSAETAINCCMLDTDDGSRKGYVHFVISTNEPRFSEIVILADNVRLKPLGIYQIEAFGLDLYGQEIELDHTLLGYSSGTIDPNGTYTPPIEEDKYQVHLPEVQSYFEDSLVVIDDELNPAEEALADGADGIQISIEPNPITSSSVVRITMETTSQPIVELFTVTGESLGTLPARQTSEGEFIAKLPWENLRNGTYYFVVRDGQRTNSGKFVRMD